MQEARLDLALQVIVPLLTTENLIVIAEDHKVRLDAADLKLKAIAQLVKVVQTQNVLCGLNAPTKLEVKPEKKSTLEPLTDLRARVLKIKENRRNMVKGATS